MNDFRRQKSLLALGILTMGMLAACLWCALQGWGLHRGYPYNTFLWSPLGRFSDFNDFLEAARLPDPYGARVSLYFPFSYAVFHWVPPAKTPAMYAVRDLFWGLNLVGVLLLLGASLRALEDRKTGKGPFSGAFKPYFGALLFLLLLYPVWFCIDRGNIEFLIALLIGAFLYLLARHRYPASLACLVPAICFKLYPAVLLVLYLRPGRIRWLALAIVSALVLSFVSLASFEGSWRQNAGLLHDHLAAFDYKATIRNEGLAGSSTLWNACKIALDGFHFISLCLVHGWQPISHASGLSDKALLFDETIYSLCMSVGAILVTLYACLIETEFSRRVVVLVVYMVVASPAGADYKLLHIGTALVVWILISTRRRHDLPIAGLLAFALIPKKEVVFPFLGISDSQFRDISIGVFLTPLSLLSAGSLLVWDGWSQADSRWSRQRLRNLFVPIFARFPSLHP